MNLSALIALAKSLKTDKATLRLFAPLIVLALRWLADSIEKDPDTVFGLIEKLTEGTSLPQ